jgi:26S proteasome regulatory subunit T5
MLKNNKDKIKLHCVLPYLVSTINEVIDMEPEEEDLDDIDANKNIKGKSVVIKTSLRTTVFLPNVCLINPEEIKPGELVGVNKDTFLIYEKLPNEYDSRGI